MCSSDLDAAVAKAVQEVMDFRPQAIIDRLGLRNPIFTATAAYGHFGRQPELRVPDVAPTGGPVWFFPWERIDVAEDLRSAAGQ